MLMPLQGPGEVGHGEEDKDQRLDDGHEESQDHHGQRNQKGDQPKDDAGNIVITEDVAEETNGEGYRSDKMPDKLDGYHQGGQPDNRANELFEVFDPVFSDAIVVGEAKDGDGAGPGGVEGLRGGVKPRYQAQDIGGEDEEGQGSDNHHKLRPPRSHIILDDLEEALDDHLPGGAEGQLCLGDKVFFGVLAQSPRTQIGEDHENDDHNNCIGNMRILMGDEVQQGYYIDNAKAFMTHRSPPLRSYIDIP